MVIIKFNKQRINFHSKFSRKESKSLFTKNLFLIENKVPAIDVMKKEYLTFLSISMIFLLFLIPFVISDMGNLNKINKGFELNTSSNKISNNNFKHIHETDYNLTLEPKNNLKYASKILNNNKLNIDNSYFNVKA